MSMVAVTGVVQHYAWGDPVSIPDLLGVPGDGRPWAELWLGTHPGGHSTVTGGARLADVAGRLPYLLKVLAARAALSLQTHPSAEQAAAGFAREDAAGIPRDAPRRIYRDTDAKPELICALTPFDALCGFRPVTPTTALLRRLGALELATALESEGLPAVVRGLYRGRIPVASTIAACAGRDEPEAQLVQTLARQYPGDPSVAVTLLLHRVHLRPGEAIFLGPGNLHAYLNGVGVEIMGASDNVVRGGLTAKHVDVEELLAVLDISPSADPVIAGTHHPDGWTSYDTPGTPFRLWRRSVDDPFHHVATGRELLLCTDGCLGALRRGETVFLAPGESVELHGTGTLFRVEERIAEPAHLPTAHPFRRRSDEPRALA